MTPRRVSAVAGGAVVTLPFAIALTRLIVHPAGSYHLTADLAMIELATRDVLEGTRLLGPYSRFGWNHPGPAYFAFLAPFYAALGHRPEGLHAGVVALSLLSALGTVAVVWRRAGERAGWWTALVVLVFCLTLGADALRALWNPTAIVLPTLLFVVLCAAGATGSLPALVGAAVVASFLAQTHLGTAPFVAVLGAASLGAAVATGSWRSLVPVGARARVAVGLGVAVLVAMWVPPVIETLTRAPGNVVELARFVLQDRRGHALGDAAAVVAVVSGTLPFGLPPPIAPADVAPLRALAAAVAGGVAAVCAVVGMRRREPFLSALGALSVGGMGVAVVLATQVDRNLNAYLLFWVAALPAAAWVALAASAGAASRPGEQRRNSAAPVRPRAVAPAVVASLAALALSTAVLAQAPAAVAAASGSYDGGKYRSADAAVGRALALIFAATPRPGGRRIHVAICDPLLWEMGAGIVVGLEKAGWDVTVPDDYVRVFGPHYRSWGREDVALVLTRDGQVSARTATADRRLGQVRSTVLWLDRLPQPGSAPSVGYETSSGRPSLALRGGYVALR